MKKSLLLYCLATAILFLPSVHINAQSSSAIQIATLKRDHAVTRIVLDTKGVPTFLEGNLTPKGTTGDAKEKAYIFFEQNRLLFGLGDPRTELRVMRQRTDRLGMVHLRFRQFFRGVRVYGREVYAHFTPAHDLKTINGGLLPDIDVPTSPRIPADNAAQSALASLRSEIRVSVGAPKLNIILQNSELVIFPFAGKTYLAWLVQVLCDNPPGRWDCFINALDGTVIAKANRVISESGRELLPHSGITSLIPPEHVPAAVHAQEGKRVLHPDIRRSTTMLKHAPARFSGADWDTIMTEGFEGTFPHGLWTVSDTMVDATWGVQTYKSHGGTHAAWCAASGVRGVPPSGGVYLDSVNAWMVYGPFDLSNIVAAELSFFLSSVTEQDHDNFWVVASLDSNMYYGVPWSGDHGDWTKQTFDLSDVYSLGNLCGQQKVYVAFVFISDSANHAYAGTFLDDITLRIFPDSGVPAADAIGTGTGVLGDVQNNIETYGVPGRFLLEDHTRRANNDPHGHHGQMRSDQSIITSRNSTGSPMVDFDNVWQDSAQAAGVDAQVYTGLIYDYMLSQLGRNSFNDSGSTMRCVEQITPGPPPPLNMNNAIWTGTEVYFLDVTTNPLSMAGSIDIVGHEWAHGITQNESGLLLSGEPGSLNESFSDIMGTAVAFTTGIDPDWQHGEHSYADGSASRDLSDPHATYQPDTYLDDPYWRGGEYFNVHTNDGVPNKMFYLLSVGGTHNGVSVIGIGIANAMQVFYRANCYYWISTTTFSDAKEGCISAANDLDATGIWGTQARKAWEAVKVGIPISPTHFKSVWFIRPYLPMNIVVTKASFDGVDLVAADEIGVFDDSICMGMTIVGASISSQQPLMIAAFTDDPTTPEIDGFHPGHSICFRFWKASDSTEIPNSAISATYLSGQPLFVSEDSARVRLSGTSVVSVHGKGSASESIAPRQPILFDSYPNPFNSSAILTYYLPRVTGVTLKVYNILGEETRTLAIGLSSTGYHKIMWDGRNNDGISVSTGIYLVRFVAEGVLMTKKLLLLR